MTGAGSNQATIARYIASHTTLAMPPEIVEAARLCLADWMAVAIGAGDEPAGRIIRSTVAA